MVFLRFFEVLYKISIRIACQNKMATGNRKGHRDPPKGIYRFVRLVCFGEEEEKELRIICKGNKSSPLRGRTKVGEKNKIKRG